MHCGWIIARLAAPYIRPAMPRSPRLAAAISGLLAASLLAGCAAVPHVSPQVSTADAANMGLADRTPVVVAPDWWTAMGDPQLDRIMADALANSPTLAEAEARLRAARAQVAGGQAALRPQIGANASEQRQRLSEHYIIPPPYGGSGQWVGTTEADLDWSLDLAGRQHAVVAGARASAAAAALDVAAARVALAGAVAQAYVDFARADAQARIAADFVASREASLGIARTRRRTDLGSDFDVSAAQALLAEARQAGVRAQGQRRLTIHALAALAGRGIDAYAGTAAPALRLDSAIPVPATIPADLIARRADIQAARARIENADAGRRAARAAFYPDINLHAFVGTAALGLGSLFTAGAVQAGVGPAIHLPIFSGGRLAADYRGAVAGIDIAAAQYDQLVVQAVRQAADALTQVDAQSADAAQQRTIVAELERTAELDAVRVRSGLGSRLDILGANDRLLAARQAQANIDADGAIGRIRLLVALGGGFTPLAPSFAAADSGHKVTP